MRYKFNLHSYFAVPLMQIFAYNSVKNWQTIIYANLFMS